MISKDAALRTLKQSARKSWQNLRQVEYPLLVALITTILTYLFGWCAVTVTERRSLGPWLDLWTRWDVLQYLHLAQNWYGGRAPSQYGFAIAFLPLHPLAIRLIHFLVPNWQLAALVVANVCCAGGFVYLFLLAQNETDVPTARRAVWYLAIYPWAFFFHVGYSESLFLLVSVAAFYYARRGRWAGAAICAMLATGSRLPGLLLLPALAVEYLAQKNFRWRDVRLDCAWLALAPLGLLFYLWINHHYYQNAFYFTQVQQQHWHHKLASPFVALAINWNGLWHDPRPVRVMERVPQLAALLLGAAGVVLSAWRLRLSFTVYIALSWLLFFGDATTLSTPRFLTTQFPLFLALALVTGRNWLSSALTFTSILFYALFVQQFARGWWTA